VNSVAAEIRDEAGQPVRDSRLIAQVVLGHVDGPFLDRGPGTGLALKIVLEVGAQVAHDHLQPVVRVHLLDRVAQLNQEACGGVQGADPSWRRGRVNVVGAALEDELVRPRRGEQREVLVADGEETRLDPVMRARIDVGAREAGFLELRRKDLRVSSQCLVQRRRRRPRHAEQEHVGRPITLRGCLRHDRPMLMA
jgi:hypothetical protein